MNKYCIEIIAELPFIDPSFKFFNDGVSRWQNETSVKKKKKKVKIIKILKMSNIFLFRYKLLMRFLKIFDKLQIFINHK